MAEEIQDQTSSIDSNVSTPAVADVPPSNSRRSKGKSKKGLWIIIAVVIVLLLGVGGWTIFSSPGEEEDALPTPASTPTSAPTNTPTPSEEISKEEIKIQVLNGTGIAGEATFVKEGLEGLGYTDIVAENADETDVVITTVTFVDGVSTEVQDEITQYLKKYFEDVETDTASSLGGFDVKILLGYRKGYSPTPTGASTTTTPTPTGAKTTTTPTVTKATTPTPTP